MPFIKPALQHNLPEDILAFDELNFGIDLLLGHQAAHRHLAALLRRDYWIHTLAAYQNLGFSSITGPDNSRQYGTQQNSEETRNQDPAAAECHSNEVARRKGYKPTSALKN